ncbi:uncharacterized protein LOC107304607 [Oryza brachyantha]|uniref:uncharacterized protein LOC107304607 n=1 Tax=Oryza brachyantha TaxID=4533 RepID=UPI001ADCF2A9|nr:uncharacterized protein LOC107304607 [Oryza brachyantha]
MAASEESAIQKKLKPEEQEAQPAVTAIADRTEEEDKAEDFISAAAAAAAAATSAHHAAVAGAGAGGVAEEMENGGGSGGAGGQQAAAAVAPAPGPEVVRSPLAAAVARLENHVLERVVKVLLKKCYPPQDGFPMTGKYPPPPPWWPNGRERWWHELGEGVEAPPYKPARLLSKEQKVVAVVAMVKNIAPDYERLAMAMQMASSVTSIITDAEAMAWDAGVTRERDAYIARHPRSAPPTRAWSLMRTLKPEAVRMKRRQPRPPVRINAQDAVPATATATAADSAAMEAAIAMIEAMKNKLKDPNAPYFPMPYPLLPPGTFEIIHDTEVDPHDDPENPIIWKEYTRIQGNLVLKRAGRKKGGVEIYDSVKEEGEGSSSGGPRRGRLVMETNAQAQAYYRSLRNNGAPAGGAAGAGRTDKGKETAEAGGSGIYQNAGAGVKTEHEDEHSEASNKGSGAILQPNKGI